MKQILLVCAVALLASCGKYGSGTFSIKNEYDEDLSIVTVVQYDEAGSNLGKKLSTVYLLIQRLVELNLYTVPIR